MSNNVNCTTDIRKHLITNVNHFCHQTLLKKITPIQACNKISNVALDYNDNLTKLDDDIQAIRMNDYIDDMDNASVLKQNFNNVKIRPHGLLSNDKYLKSFGPKDNIDNNSIKYVPSTNTIRPINLTDVLDFGNKIIAYLRNPNGREAKKLIN